MHHLYKLRYVFIIGTIVSLLNAVILVLASVLKAAEGYRLYMKFGGHSPDMKPGIYLLESLDLILVSIVFFTIGMGIFRLVVKTAKDEDKEVPAWLQIKTLTDLKFMLWETILVTMVALCFTKLASSQGFNDWSLLIYPVIILILSIAFYVVKKVHH